MDANEPEQAPPLPVVVRDNTGILLLLVSFVFVTMVLLSVSLVRLGNINRKMEQLTPRFSGGGAPGVKYFYVP